MNLHKWCTNVPQFNEQDIFLFDRNSEQISTVKTLGLLWNSFSDTFTYKWLPQEFQSTVQQIYRWKEEDLRTAVKIEAELILEANRLQLLKQDLEKTETVYFSNFLSKKKLSKVPRNVNTVPCGMTATPADPSGKT
ncbi:uncharacterized protein TNCT_695091 [Trichonephila clavata]|uniref:Uncharacterized protein n=1 Tax=Trichonephila clavata TaxID=2740835 RepID=A0A8X6KJ70_TRICU|nr:uncharacterized protein TNCT_695091 [Trichonephila clavata]